VRADGNGESFLAERPLIARFPADDDGNVNQHACAAPLSDLHHPNQPFRCHSTIAQCPAFVCEKEAARFDEVTWPLSPWGLASLDKIADKTVE